jgi:hypothetical protein
MPRPRKNTNAFLEPVLTDGLRLPHAGDTFKRTLAATRSFSPAVIRALREIFSVPRFEEILTDIFDEILQINWGPLETHAVDFFVTRV